MESEYSNVLRDASYISARSIPATDRSLAAGSCSDDFVLDPLPPRARSNPNNLASPSGLPAMSNGMQRFESLSASQRTVQKSLDQLRVDLGEVQKDVRRILEVVVQAHADGALRSTAPGAAPPAKRHTKRLRSLHSGLPAASASLLLVPQTPVADRRPSSDESSPEHSSATAGIATVNLGSAKSQLRKSLTLQEMGKIGEISALLPTGWPNTVLLRDAFQASPTQAQDIPLAEVVPNVRLTSQGSQSSHNDKHALSLVPSDARRRCSCMRHLGCRVFHPHSRFRTTFDVLSLIVLMYELVLVPYSLAWDVGEMERYGYQHFSTICTATFWLLDIVFSFFTGFYRDGEVVTNLREIARRYMRSYFVLDFFAVAGDWLTLVLFAFGPNEQPTFLSRILRLAKFGRFARLLGLMRLLRLMALMNQFMEAQMSEAWRLLARIFQMSFALLWFAHLTACVWNALGRLDYGNEETWRDTPVGLVGEPYKDLPAYYQYCTSYHWSMTQITLGAHDINPVNAVERLFTVIVNIFGLIFGGTLVSVLSASLIDFREIHKSRKDKIRTLRYFLHQNEVELDVTARVLGQVSLRASQAEVMTTAEDVPALSYLSTNLRSDLYYALFAPHLKKLALFRAWEHVQSQCVQHLCNETMEFIVLMVDDELFNTGVKAVAAYNMISGKMIYDQEKSSPPHNRTTVRDGWLSEGALWTEWVHVGNAQASEYCKLLAVGPDSVIAAVQKNHVTRSLTVEYGKLFHRCVKEADQRNLPSDLQVAHASLGELMGSMPMEIQQILGLAALEYTSVTKKKKVEKGLNVEKLEEHVRQGHFALLLDEDSELQCVCSKAVLNIERADDGWSLCQIAFRLDAQSGWQPKCSLPQVQLGEGELPTDALRQMVRNQLQPLIGHLKVNNITCSCRHVSASHSLPKSVVYETIFQVLARSLLCERLLMWQQAVQGMAGICGDITTALRKPARRPMPNLTYISEILSDEAEDQLTQFPEDPHVYVIDDALFCWMPELISSYLSGSEGAQHLSALVDACNNTHFVWPVDEFDSEDHTLTPRITPRIVDQQVDLEQSDSEEVIFR